MATNELQFRITADTISAQDAIKAIQQRFTDLNEASKKASTIFAEVNTSLKQLAQNQADLAFQKIKESEANATAQANVLKESIAKLDQEFRQNIIDSETYAKAINSLYNELKKLGNANIKIDSKIFDYLAIAQFDAEIKKLSGDEIKLQNDTQLLNATLAKLRQEYASGAITLEQFGKIQASILAQANPNALSVSQSAILSYNELKNALIATATETKIATETLGLLKNKMSEISQLQANNAFLKIQESEQRTATETKILIESMTLLDNEFKKGGAQALNYANAMQIVYAEIQKLSAGGVKLDSKLFDPLALAQYDAELKKLINDEISLNNETNLLNATLSKLNKEYQAGAISADQFAKIQSKILSQANPKALTVDHQAILSYDEVKNKISETEQKLQSLKIALKMANDEFKKSGEGKKAIQELENQIKSLGGNVSVFDKIKGGFAGVFEKLSGLAGPAMMATQLITSLIHKILEINEVENKLHAVVVSEKLFADAMDYTADIAKKYGQNLLQVRDSYASFMGSAMQTNLTLNQAKLAYEGVTAAGAALHLSSQKMGFVFLALEQMMSKGVVQTQELRRQLGEHLPGSMAIAAKTLGITVDVLVKKLEAGQIAAIEFVPKFAAELKKVYGELAEIIADESPVAAINRLKNAWTEAVEAMGKNGLNQSIKESSDILAMSLSDSRDALVFLGNAVGLVIEALAMLVAMAGKVAEALHIIFIKPFQSLNLFLNGVDQTKKSINELTENTEKLIDTAKNLENVSEFQTWFIESNKQARLLDEEFLKQVKSLEALKEQKKEILKSQIDETEKQNQIKEIDEKRVDVAHQLQSVMGAQKELSEATKQTLMQQAEIESKKLGITTAAYTDAKKILDNITATNNDQIKTQDKLSQIMVVINQQLKDINKQLQDGVITENQAYEARKKAYEAQMVATEKHRSETQKVTDDLTEQAVLAGLIGTKHDIVSTALKIQKDLLKEGVVMSQQALQQKIQEITVIKIYEEAQKRLNALQQDYKKFMQETVNTPFFKMPDLKNLYEIETKYNQFKEFAKNNAEEMVKLDAWHEEQTTGIKKKLVDEVNKNVADHHKALVDLKNNLQKAYSDINKIEHESKEQTLQVAIEVKYAQDKLIENQKQSAEKQKEIQEGIKKSNDEYNKSLIDANKEFSKAIEDSNKSINDAYNSRNQSIQSAIKSFVQAQKDFATAQSDVLKSEIDANKNYEIAKKDHADKLKNIAQSIIDKETEIATKSKDLNAQKIQIEKDYQEQLKSLQDKFLTSQQDYQYKLYGIKTRNMSDDDKQSAIKKQIKDYIDEANKLSGSGDLKSAQEKLKKAMGMADQIKNDQLAIQTLNDAYDALKKVEEKIYQQEKLKAEDDYQAKIKANLEEQKKLQSELNQFKTDSLAKQNQANQAFADAETKRNQELESIKARMADAEQKLWQSQIEANNQIREANNQANQQIREANEKRFEAEQKLIESRNQAEEKHNDDLKKFAKEQEEIDTKKRTEAEKQQLILKEIKLLETELIEAKANGDKDEIKRIGEKLIALGKTLDDSQKMNQIVTEGLDAVNQARELEKQKINEVIDVTKEKINVEQTAYNKSIELQKDLQSEIIKIQDIARDTSQKMFDDFNRAFQNLKSVGGEATQSIAQNLSNLSNLADQTMAKISQANQAQAIQSQSNNSGSYNNDYDGEYPALATGGYVSGPGTATSDSIHAMLSNGEYVINANAVSKFGINFFDLINYNTDHTKEMLKKISGNFVLPKYATGGYVTTNTSQSTNSTSVSNSSQTSSITIQNLHLNGIQDVQKLVKELENYSRKNPIKLNIGNEFSKSF